MEALGPEQLERVLAEAVRRLRAEFGPCRVYLFGSYAEGRAGKDSDLDLMVVLPRKVTFTDGVRARQALAGMGVPKDVLVRSAADFTSRAAWVSSVERQVAERGRLLHAA